MSPDADWDTYRQYNFNKRTYDENNGITCFSAPWSGAYKNIRAVNLGIEKISSSSILTEAQKNQFLGECYFFRAFIYFDMEKFWGSVPYVDKALTIEDETYLPRTKRETIFIISTFVKIVLSIRIPVLFIVSLTVI